MEHVIASVIEILRQTEATYKRLLALIEMEKSAVLASDIDQLTAAGAEKQVVISQLTGLEQQRQWQLQLLGKALRLPCETLNLSDLSARIDAPYKEQLRDLQQRLNRVVERANHANNECRMLVRHCLRLVQNALGFFQHWMDTANVYGASGDMSGMGRSGGRLVSGCA
jgi:Mg2+ and Co2+ transporter CorA